MLNKGLAINCAIATLKTKKWFYYHIISKQVILLCRAVVTLIITKCGMQAYISYNLTLVKYFHIFSR